MAIRDSVSPGSTRYTVGSGVGVNVGVGGGVTGAGVAVAAGVGPDGGEKVAPASGPGVAVGMRAMTCPHADRKSSAARTPMADRADLLAIIERELICSGTCRFY